MSGIVPHRCAQPETLHQLEPHMLPPHGPNEGARYGAQSRLYRVRGKEARRLRRHHEEIRTWLDHCKIQPASFKPVAQVDSSVGFEIGFNSEGEAHLFEQAFRVSTRLPVFC